jgi:ABC-type nitrate/sulfonate/bicarbonate transport system substrate-binding protein
MLPIQLQLDWKPNAQFAGILVAHHFKWYEQQGIDLQIRPWEPYLNQVDVLKESGNVIISTEDNLLIRGRENGQPIKAIATMMQYSGIGWITLTSSNIHAISDFAGKRIGIHGDGETAIKITLEQFGLGVSDVEIVEIGYDYPQLLQSGEFDAIQCLVMVEPLELVDEGFDIQVIPAYKWGYEVYSQVIATSEQLIEAEPNRIQQFLQTTFDGWRYAFTHTQEAANIVVSQYLHESTSEMQENLIKALYPLFIGQLGPEKLGWMNAARWAKSIKYLIDYNVIQQAFKPEEIMTNYFMEQIYGLDEVNSMP